MSIIAGKSSLVLGGVGGIGRTIVSNLLNAGLTRLAVIDIVDEGKAHDSLIDLIKQYPTIKFNYAKCLVEDEPELRQVMGNLSTDMGGFDFVINSVGILDEWDPKKTILINYVSVISF